MNAGKGAWALLLTILLVGYWFPACHSSAGKSDINNDYIANSPIAGDRGELAVSEISSHSLVLTWTKAIDNQDDNAVLQYKVVMSKNNDIQTAQNAEMNGDVVQDWETDLNRKKISNLKQDANYYFNVLVKDTEENTDVYRTISASTHYQLDREFNKVGSVLHNGAAGGSASDQGHAVVLDNNGKIVVVGHSYKTYKNMTIWRYNPDGSLDTTFNDTGYLSHVNPDGDGEARGVSLDKKGRIIAIGYRDCKIPANALHGAEIVKKMTVWRYNPNGLLDTTFNGKGFVSHDVVQYNVPYSNNYTINDNLNFFVDSQGYGVAIDGQNKVWVTGYERTFLFLGEQIRRYSEIVKKGQDAVWQHSMVLWGYNENGSPAFVKRFNFPDYTKSYIDRRSGEEIPVYYSYTEGRGITLDDGDNILITGWYIDDKSGASHGNRLMAAWRYNTGSLLSDDGFNNNGYIFHSGARSIKTFDGEDSVRADIMKYSFDKRHHAAGESVAVDEEGQILITGYTSPPSLEAKKLMTIWRYNTNGSLDTTFNAKGYVQHSGDYSYKRGSLALGLDIKLNNNKILVFGAVYGDGATKMAVWRYGNNGEIDKSLDDGGIILYEHSVNEALLNHQGNGFVIDSNNGVFIVGRSEKSNGDYDMAIWKINNSLL